MASLKLLNPKSEIASKTHALAINISAAKGLMEVLKSNLGPRGTIKMYYCDF
jgi:T-complex protein 1 subunit zeta